RPGELLEKMKSALPPPPPREPPPAPREEIPVPDLEPPPTKNDPADKKQGDAPESVPKPTPMRDAGGNVVPDNAIKLIELRRGFANYHFNRKQQTRFIERLRKRAIAEPPPWKTTNSEGATWRIEGSAVLPPSRDQAIGDEVSIEVLLGDRQVVGRLGDAQFVAENPSDLADAIDRRDALGGLVTALAQWRRMVTLGPGRFGDTTAWGTAPVAGSSVLRDWTIGIDGDLETHFYQSSTSDRLEKVEVFVGRDDDPAELWVAPEIDAWATLSDSEMSEDDRPVAASLTPRDGEVLLELRYGLDWSLAARVRWIQAGSNNRGGTAEGVRP
ncbi:MAG: hypothetical protein AAGD07_15245, partial [Planctomycetota bacterium]